MTNPQPPEFEARSLRSLLDRQQVKAVLARYCRGVDRLDAELLRSAFWPDAWDNHGRFSGNRDEFIDWVIPFLRDQYVSGSHLISNHLIELRDDVALSECYFDATYCYTSEGKDYTRQSRGRYIDRLERRGDQWRIARRTVVNDWARNDPVVAPAPLRQPGLRDRGDASYELWQD